jgi:FKBP-type peptidyl-prolyl cis-trans isomerase
MNRLFKAIAAFLLLFVVASCNNESSIYDGFKKMENGAYMKFYSKGNSEVMPRLKDEATFEMAQYFNDSLLFTTAGDEPMRLILTEADFTGDVVDGLLMMHVGDSARLAVSADSVFTIMFQMEEIPEEYAGKPIYYDLKLLSVKPFETLEAERNKLLDSLKREEEAFLTPLRDDLNNKVTESGIIVLEKTGKGKVATLGDYVNFDFTMCNPKGDTIMNSFGVETVEMQYGEEFICEGFNEALGMVPEGGTMRFVIPSALAFDSTGYEKFIHPYMPLVVRLQMNSVMDKEAYNQKQAALEAEKEAERDRMAVLENQKIEEYIKANGITETPTETGLYIIRQEEGEGEVAKWGDEVSVHYIMSNLNGDELESSYNYDQPITFHLGKDMSLPAMEEALMTMAPGAKVTLISPSALAFGDYEVDKERLPAYSPLVIELELVEIK